MHSIAPSGKDSATDTLEKRLWDAADQFWANSGPSAQYSQPVLGLIFLRFAEIRFSKQRAVLEKAGASSRRGSRVDEPGEYHAGGILYLAPDTRFDFLLNLPEAAGIGAKVSEAMRDIEKHNPQLAGVLPKTYNLFTGTLLKELLKKVSETVAYANAHSQGATIPYAVWGGSHSEMQLVLRPETLLRRFGRDVAPMLAQISRSFFALNNLRRTRDLLLARLLSEQVNLEER